VRSAPAHQVVEKSVRADVEVDGRRQIAREIRGGAGGGVEESDPVGAEVREEVLADERARKLGGWRVVKGAARDCTARRGGRTVLVSEERRAKAGVGRHTLGRGPPVVRPGDAVVDI